MKFYSHPNILLKAHLKGVGTRASKFIENLPIKDKKKIADVAKIIGYCHDFGKYTSFFQDYLSNNKNHGVKSHHSLISALLGAWQIQKLINRLSLSNKKTKKFLPLIAYLVIHRHHGDLRSPEEIIPSKKDLNDYPKMSQMASELKEEILAVRDQIKDLKKNLIIITKEIEELGISGIKEFLDENKILEIFKQLDLLRYEMIEKDELSDEDRVELYFLSLLLFSALIDGDKRIAANVTEISRRDIPSNIVDCYIESKLKGDTYSINKMRKEIYRSVIKKIAPIPLNNHIFTLTAPTGSGKTLTALSAALKLKDRITKKKNYKPRIIYCLPFINVIEQTYQVFYQVLSQIPDFKNNQSSYLIKHHHLEDLEYKLGNENLPLDEALLLTESWESEIIVTTFIQFFHTIIGFKNNFLKKMHNIAGSIIILDEIQNIPVEYWDLTNRVLKGLTEILGCTIIQMTATKPLIFNEAESIELLENNEKYFKQLNRVTLKPLLDKEISKEEFVDWFVQTYSKEKSYLIVTNTISMSQDVYLTIKQKINDGVVPFVEFDEGKEISIDALAQKFLELNKIPIIYLSTNIIPRQRRKRIEFLKEFLSKNGKAILISTQVVEAGVDLDFQEVIRDIGPLDSIIQVAGRCNRNNVMQKGEVIVIRLKKGRVESVYGRIHPFISSVLLKNLQKIDEKDFYGLIEDYFCKVKERISNSRSKDIWEAVLNLRFHHEQLSNISEFQLIDEKGIFVDVFVEMYDKAKELRERFLNEVLHEKEFQKRHQGFLRLKKDFREYIISIRMERVRNNLPPKMEKGNMYFIPLSQLSDYYDLETGYKELNACIL